MLIKDLKVRKKFKDTCIGDVIRFAYGSDLAKLTYMVITDCHEENGDHVNLVCLDDGGLYYATDEDDVELLNVELIIKNYL